jgi:hypothetical protein
MWAWVIVALIVAILISMFAFVIGWAIGKSLTPEQLAMERAGYEEFEQWRAEQEVAEQNKKSAAVSDEEVALLLKREASDAETMSR